MADPVPSSEISAEDTLDAQRQVHEFRKAFYHSQGLKLQSYAWAEIALDSPALPSLLAALEDLQARGIATPGSGLPPLRFALGGWEPPRPDPAG